MKLSEFLNPATSKPPIIAKGELHPTVTTQPNGVETPVQAREATEAEPPPLDLSYLVPEPVGCLLDGRPIYRTPAGNEIAPMTEAEREAFEEKAAVIEFESGLVDHIADDFERRAMAERIAMEPGTPPCDNEITMDAGEDGR